MKTANVKTGNVKTADAMSASNKYLRYGAACVAMQLVSGCAFLEYSPSPPPVHVYALDRLPDVTLPTSISASTSAPGGPTLVVSTPLAASGFDSRHMMYARQPHQLDYFANSEWADTPARMLAPLVIQALQNGGAFHAVVPAPGSVRSALRLKIDTVQLQQGFETTPSRARFSLHATLVEEASRRVIAARDFDATATAPSEDAYGGVVAANKAVQEVLSDLSAFGAQAAREWQPTKK